MKIKKNTVKNLKQNSKLNITENDIINAYFDVMMNCYDFAKTEIMPIISNTKTLTHRESAFIGLYSRLYLNLKTLVKLNHNSHFQAHAILTRTILEILVDIEMLSRDKTDTSINRFHAYTEIQKYKSAINIINDSKSNVKIKRYFVLIKVSQLKKFARRPKKEEEMEALIKTNWALNLKEGLRLKHWSGQPNLKDRMKSISPKYHCAYLELYPMLSWYTHSGSAGYTGKKVDFFSGIIGTCSKINILFFQSATKILKREIKLVKKINNINQIISSFTNMHKDIILESKLRQ